MKTRHIFSTTHYPFQQDAHFQSSVLVASMLFQDYGFIEIGFVNSLKTWEGALCSVIEQGMTSLSFQTAIEKDEAKLNECSVH